MVQRTSGSGWAWKDSSAGPRCTWWIGMFGQATFASQDCAICVYSQMNRSEQEGIHPIKHTQSNTSGHAVIVQGIFGGGRSCSRRDHAPEHQRPRVSPGWHLLDRGGKAPQAHVSEATKYPYAIGRLPYHHASWRVV